MQRQVGLYARISEDTEGAGAGVSRQAQDALRLAELRGWEVVERYVDNDVSAYKRTVVREQFERMLVDLKAGVIEGIVAYDLDRFARQPRDLERAIDIYEARKDLVFATVQGDINLQSADGRTMARVMVAFANKSSADAGRRIARKHLENAREGKPVGGFRPFGWNADKTTLHPRESEAVRHVIDELLAGAQLSSMVRWVRDAGFKTTAGKDWTGGTLRQYLRNPRLVGWRTHRREVLLTDAGTPVEGRWEPMVSRDTWERLQALLVKPEQRSRVPRRNERVYLLTGLLRCGICSQRMYGNKRGDTFYYGCAQVGAGHSLGVSGAGVDAAIRELALARLAAEQLDAAPTRGWSGQARLDEIDGLIAQLMHWFRSGTMSAEVVLPQVSALEEERTELRASRAQWVAETTGPAVQHVDRRAWDELTVDKRRALLERLLDAVLVLPATQRGNRFDPNRLVPVWRVPR